MGPARPRDGPRPLPAPVVGAGTRRAGDEDVHALGSLSPNRVVTAALQDGIFGRGERQELLINLLWTVRR